MPDRERWSEFFPARSGVEHYGINGIAVCNSRLRTMMRSRLPEVRKCLKCQKWYDWYKLHKEEVHSGVQEEATN